MLFYAIDVGGPLKFRGVRKSPIRRRCIAYTTVTTVGALMDNTVRNDTRKESVSHPRTYVDRYMCVHGRGAGIIIVLAFRDVYATTIQTARFASDFRER